MQDTLYSALRAFISYKEIKQELQINHISSSIELEQARDKIIRFLPSDLDPDELISEWEKQFRHAEQAFHHQGG